MKNSLFYVLVILVIAIFPLVSCQSLEDKEITEEEPATIEESVKEEDSFEESTETTKEDLEETEKENINKFFEQIKEYDILVKNFNYSLLSLAAISDWADGKISRKDVGSRYMEITSEVRSDYFSFDILFMADESLLEKEGITVTDDMERVVELISRWKDKKERYYEYMAKYYYGDGPEYEIEADNIEEELEEIKDEYIELTNEMAKKVESFN